MDHKSLNFEVSDPWWLKVETKVSPWGGDDHTINFYPLRGGAVVRSFDLTLYKCVDRLAIYRVKGLS